MPEYRAHGAWLVVTDAGPAPPPRLQNNWGPLALAWLVHWQATDFRPTASGATYVRRLSVNRGEHLAVLAGLRCLRDGLEVHGEWQLAPVHVLTDSALVVDLMTGVRRADVMRPYCDAIQREAARIEALTAEPVRYVRAGDRENRRADGLVRTFASAQRGHAQQVWP